MKHNYQPKHDDRPAPVTKLICGRPAKGYANVKCVRCGDNIKFYIKALPPVCSSCSDMAPSHYKGN